MYDIKNVLLALHTQMQSAHQHLYAHAFFQINLRKKAAILVAKNYFYLSKFRIEQKKQAFIFNVKETFAIK